MDSASRAGFGQSTHEYVKSYCLSIVLAFLSYTVAGPRPQVTISNYPRAPRTCENLVTVRRRGHHAVSDTRGSISSVVRTERCLLRGRRSVPHSTNPGFDQDKRLRRLLVTNSGSTIMSANPVTRLGRPAQAGMMVERLCQLSYRPRVAVGTLLVFLTVGTAAALFSARLYDSRTMLCSKPCDWALYRVRVPVPQDIFLSTRSHTSPVSLLSSATMPEIRDRLFTSSLLKGQSDSHPVSNDSRTPDSAGSILEPRFCWYQNGHCLDCHNCYRQPRRLSSSPGTIECAPAGFQLGRLVCRGEWISA